MEENKTTKQKICPNCGEHLTPEQDVCPVCGLGYAAYMEVKSNPKAELAKLYELVESYDPNNYFLPKDRCCYTGMVLLYCLIEIAIMCFLSIGLIESCVAWLKIWGYPLIGGVIIVPCAYFIINKMIDKKNKRYVINKRMRIENRIRQIDDKYVINSNKRKKEYYQSHFDLFTYLCLSLIHISYIIFCGFILYEINEIIYLSNMEMLGLNIVVGINIIRCICYIIQGPIEDICPTKNKSKIIDIISSAFVTISSILTICVFLLLGILCENYYISLTIIRWWWLYTVITAVYNMVAYRLSEVFECE